jgi:integrase
LAEAGQKKEVRLRDTLVPGLCIRIRGRTASWQIMTRSQSIRLAGVEELSVRDARDRAREVLQEKKPHLKRAVAAMLEAGIPPVDANLIARGLPIDPTDKWVDTWTWNDAMEKFLLQKQEAQRIGWFRQYKKFAQDDAFFPVQYQALAKLTYGKLDLIRQEVRENYPPSRAKRVMAAAIELLDWVWAEHRTEAGLEKLAFPWWRELTIKQPKGAARFVPSIDVLARTVIILRNTEGLKRSYVDALEFIVATAQRIDQVCSLERSQVEPNDDGSAIIHWTADQMKGGQPHALWVPADVVALIAAEGRLAFPAYEAGQRPIRPSVINRWLGNLWGRKSTKGKADYKGKPGPRPGTGALPAVLKMEGVPYWTPHAVRSVLATELIELMQDAAASAILGHKRSNSASLPERPSPTAHAEDVTVRFYSRAQRLQLKKQGMVVWSARLRDARARVTATILERDVPS